MFNKKTLLIFPFLIIPIFCVSCGRNGLPPKPADMPDPVPCSITVQDESGTPFVDALVRITPDDEGKWGASGATGSDGVAVLKTEGLYTGAVPGKYKVMISKKEIVSTGQISEETGGEVTDIVQHIDTKYAGPATTPLKLEVSSGGVSETFKVEKAR